MSRHGPACAAFYDHLFGCSGCYAPAGRYCEAGQRLFADYMVPQWVEDIMRRPTREQRAQALTQSVPVSIRAAVAAQVRARFHAGELPPDGDYHQRQQDRRAREVLRERDRKVQRASR